MLCGSLVFLHVSCEALPGTCFELFLKDICTANGLGRWRYFPLLGQRETAVSPHYNGFTLLPCKATTEHVCTCVAPCPEVGAQGHGPPLLMLTLLAALYVTKFCVSCVCCSRSRELRDSLSQGLGHSARTRLRQARARCVNPTVPTGLGRCPLVEYDRDFSYVSFEGARLYVDFLTHSNRLGGACLCSRVLDLCEARIAVTCSF